MTTPPTGLDIEDVREQADRIVRLRGELDMAGVPSLEAVVERIFADGARRVVVDLSELSFIDSTGLAAIVHISGLCGKHGSGFEIVRGPDAVQRLFEVTGLDGVLPFADGGASAAVAND